MPGLLSNVFGGEAEGGSVQQQSSDATLAAEQGIDLDVAVDVGIQMGGTYQDLDGSTVTWSSSQEIGLDLDVDATLGAVLTAGQGSTDIDSQA
jgi:hypothetical protein